MLSYYQKMWRYFVLFDRNIERGCMPVGGNPTSNCARKKNIHNLTLYKDIAMLIRVFGKCDLRKKVKQRADTT